MLLETLDVKKNDILIYSQNMFDMDNNFKIIYKDDESKAARKISYGDVCRFVNEYTPKNLIVYRLLTNIPDFEIFLSKYGFFLSINGVTELIYFDPIFAVKELEEYSEKLNYDLRFRIQQVGLTTLNRLNNLPNYAEIYSVDLQALEAKNQNDKVFADAIFSMEKVRNVKKASLEPLRKNTEKNSVLQTEFKMTSEIPPAKEEPAPQVKLRNAPPPRPQNDVNIISHDLSEDKDFDYRQIMKINFKGASSEINKRTAEHKAQVDMNEIRRQQQQPAAKNTQSNFGKFLHAKQINEKSENNFSLGDMQKDEIKSPSSLKSLLKGQEDPKVVLKLNKRRD